MKLYFFEKFNKDLERKERLSRALLLSALRDFSCSFNGIKKDYISLDNLGISQKGKPYFIKDIGLNFSISHCQNLWLCLISQSPVGIDVENIKSKRKEALNKIASRYFTEKEKLYVKQNGALGFFKIWTGKEAVTKLLNESLWENISAMEIDVHRGLGNSLHNIRNFHFSEDYIFTIASQGEISGEFELINMEKIYECFGTGN